MAELGVTDGTRLGKELASTTGVHLICRIDGFGRYCMCVRRGDQAERLKAQAGDMEGQRTWETLGRRELMRNVRGELPGEQIGFYVCFPGTRLLFIVISQGGKED